MAGWGYVQHVGHRWLELGRNWSSGTPTSGNDVLIIQADSANRMINYTNSGPAVVLGQITIDATGAGTMSVSQSQDTLTSTNEFIGFLGTGTYSQSGGTHTVTGTMTLAAQAGSQGTYNLSGSGSLHAGSILLNSGGTFNQTGGTLYAGTFTQAGGSVTGTLQNQGSFVYQSGQFNGRLLNQGTVSLDSNFTAANGVENDASMTLNAGQTLTANGQGLDNLVADAQRRRHLRQWPGGQRLRRDDASTWHHQRGIHQLRSVDSGRPPCGSTAAPRTMAHFRETAP